MFVSTWNMFNRRMLYSVGSVNSVCFAATELGTAMVSEVATARGAAEAYGPIVVPKEGSIHLQR